MSFKKISLVSALVLAAFALSPLSAKTQKASADGKGCMVFEQTTHDFGNIPEDKGNVSCEFEFTNEGSGKLVIINANASCGCTKPTYPEQPINPGKKGKIKVSFNPRGRAGTFTKNISVTTNGKPAKVNLKIKGTVIPKD